MSLPHIAAINLVPGDLLLGLPVWSLACAGGVGSY